MTGEAAARASTALRRAIVPLALGASIAVIPAPAGLTPNAWHFFALFVATIAALVTEPLPSPVIGLLGVTLAALLGLVASDPAASIRWALTGFSDSTVWLMFVVLMLALGYQKTGLLLCYTLGLMGVLTPYATGSAPIYYASGYITRREFWRLGAIFGAVYLAVLLGLGLPYLIMLTR